MARARLWLVVGGYAVATNALVVAQWWRETLHDDDMEHDTYYMVLIVLGVVAGIAAGAAIGEPLALALVVTWLPLELGLAANGGAVLWLPIALVAIGIGIALRRRPPPWPTPLGLATIVAYIAAGAIAAYGPTGAVSVMLVLALVAGAVLGTWWTLLLSPIPLALSVPAGYGAGDEDLPIWFGFLFFTIAAWVLIAVGVAGRRLVGRARGRRPTVQH